MKGVRYVVPPFSRARTCVLYQLSVCLVNEKLHLLTVIVRNGNDKLSQLVSRENKDKGLHFSQKRHNVLTTNR